MTRRRTPWSCARCGASGDRDTPRSKLCASCAAWLRANGLWWCIQCSQAKPQGDFPSGYQCAACLKKKGQQWRADHAEEQKRYRQAYYAANAEVLKQYRDDYYAANRDQLLAQKQLYYEAGREEIKGKARARRPRRSAASIQKEQTRQAAKRSVYKTREKLAARITLAAPIAAVDGIQCSARPEFPCDLLQWDADRTHLITDCGANPNAGQIRPRVGRLFLLVRQRPYAKAPTAEERQGGSYYLLLNDGAEPRYLAVWSGGSAGAAPTLALLERRDVPRKVVDHAQAFLRDLAARGSPLAPIRLRAALTSDRRARGATTRRRPANRRSSTKEDP